jgi:hypothetical protein
MFPTSPSSRRLLGDYTDDDSTPVFSPKRTESLLSAVLLFRQGEVDGALHALHALERIAPHDPTVLYWLGRVLVSQQRFDEASDALGMCVELMSLGEIDYASPNGGGHGRTSPTAAAPHASATPSRWRMPPPTPADISIELLVDQALEAAGVHRADAIAPPGIAYAPNGSGDVPSPLSVAAPLLHFTRGTAQQLLKSVRRVQAHRSQRGQHQSPLSHAAAIDDSPTAWATNGARRSPAMSASPPALYPPRRAPGDGSGRSLLTPRTIPRSLWERFIAVVITVSTLVASGSSSLSSWLVQIWLWAVPLPESLHPIERHRLASQIIALCVVTTLMGVLVGGAAVSVGSVVLSFASAPHAAMCRPPHTEATAPPMSFFMPLPF